MKRLFTTVLVVGLLCACGVAKAGAPLLDAARSADANAVARLLAGGADANARTADGSTALHWAVHRGDVAMIDALLQAGADATATNDYGATPMSEASVVADAAVLARLLDAGADADSPGPHGQTALMAVARTGRVDAARLLLERGADVDAREHWREQTALIWAAAQSQPAMVRLLLAHGADPDARAMIVDWQRRVTAEPRRQHRPRGGLTALLYAARQGCTDCARALVEAGADLELTDPEGISPLLMATLNARWDVADYLIDAGANVDRWDWWGRSPLYSAVDYSTVPRGGRPDRPSLDNTSALEVITRLLSAGANPNLQLKLFPPYRALGPDRGGDMMLTMGTTPLIRAAKAGDVEAVRLLLAHGANPNLPNALGFTPLLAAAGLGSNNIDTRGRFRDEGRSIDAARLIVAAGGDINAMNLNGQTAAHGSAVTGWTAFIRFLAEHGADVNVADTAGRTPLDIALGRGGGLERGGAGAVVHEDTAALLQRLVGEPTASSAAPPRR